MKTFSPLKLQKSDEIEKQKKIVNNCVKKVKDVYAILTVSFDHVHCSVLDKGLSGLKELARYVSKSFSIKTEKER